MLTINTPYAEMHREFWSDFDKCAYWVHKHQTSKNSPTYRPIAFRNTLRNYPPILPVIEYKSKTGNRWNNYCAVQAVSGGVCAMKFDSVCYWETLGSFGAFLPLMFNNEKFIAITTGHFWQRVCERTPKYKMHGVGTALDFLSEHQSMHQQLLQPRDGEHRRQVIIHMNGGVMYGVEVSHEYGIFEMRTWLDEKDLQGWRKRNHKSAQPELCDELAKEAYYQMKALGEIHPTWTVGMLLPLMKPELADAYMKHTIQMLDKDPEAVRKMEQDFYIRLAEWMSEE